MQKRAEGGESQKLKGPLLPLHHQQKKTKDTKVENEALSTLLHQRTDICKVDTGDSITRGAVSKKKTRKKKKKWGTVVK